MSTSQNQPEIPLDQQADPQHLERQIQFQRALERNLRSYIEYAQEQKKLHYIHITIFTVSLYQVAEVLVVVISMWMTYNNTLLFSFFIVSAATDLLSIIPSFYYSYLIHQNEIQFLVGLLWFQYDIEQKPQFGLQEILSQSNCICKYDAIVSVSMQTILLGLILFVDLKTDDKPLMIQWTIQMMVITRLFLILFALLIVLIKYCYRREYLKIYNQIISLQESEYEQFSPLNKYPTLIVNSGVEAQLSTILCSICLHGFILNEEYIKLQCHALHVFHQKCLTEWVAINQTCPTCRSII